MAYKEFGATIAPANISDTGFPIAMGSHIGGGRTINGKNNLKLWQLLGEGTDLTEQKNNAIGQIWYDRSDSKYYKLTGFNGDTPTWVEYLDTSNINGTTNYVTKFTGTHSIGNSLIYDNGTNVGIGTNDPIAKLQIGNDFTPNPSSSKVIYLGYSGFTNVCTLPTQMITSNSSALTPGIIGLDLHNDNNTAGAYSPMIIFSKKETGNSPYNASIAGIGARTVTGSGTSNAWIDGELIFYTAPTTGSGLLERMRIAENGNVGIGTNDPIAKLEVAGTTKLNGITKIFEASGSVTSPTSGSLIIQHGNAGGASSITFPSAVNLGSDYGYIQYQDSSVVSGGGESAKLIIGTSNDSDDDIILMPSGNVGIGTTTPAAKLHIVTTVNTHYNSLQIENNQGDYQGIKYKVTGGSGHYLAHNVLFEDNRPDTVGTVGSFFTIYRSSALSKGNILQVGSTTNASALTVKYNDFVGIGTPTPYAKLHTKGTMMVGNGPQDIFLGGSFQIQEAYGVDTSITLWQNGVCSSLIGHKATDGNLYITNTTQGGSLGYLGYSLVIKPSGNIGVGIDPSEKFEVAGTAKVQDIKVENSVKFVDTTTEKAGMRYNTTNKTIEFYFN